MPLFSYCILPLWKLPYLEKIVPISFYHSCNYSISKNHPCIVPGWEPLFPLKIVVSLYTSIKYHIQLHFLLWIKNSTWVFPLSYHNCLISVEHTWQFQYDNQNSSSTFEKGTLKRFNFPKRILKVSLSRIASKSLMWLWYLNLSDRQSRSAQRYRRGIGWSLHCH